MAGKILLVAGLLADQHHVGVTRPLSEHSLRRERVEPAALASLSGVAQGRQRLLGGQEVGCGSGALRLVGGHG